jgi:hypothetical protein
VPLVDRIRPAFLLAYNPMGWAPGKINGEPVWLPEIIEIPAVPGTNGCYTLMGQQTQADMIRSMRDYLRDERGLYTLAQDLEIPATVLPAGKSPGSWVREVTVRVAGTAGTATTYITPWHVARPGLPGPPIRFRLDRTSWDRFRRWLVAEGHVEVDATYEAVRDEYVRRAQVRLDRTESRLYPTPEVAARRVGQRQADLDFASKALTPEAA